MFKLLDAIKARRERKAKLKSVALYNRGFDYAAGALLRGEASVQQLEAEADNPFDRNEFDQGMVEAIRRIERLLPSQTGILDERYEQGVRDMSYAIDNNLRGRLDGPSPD